MPAPIELPNLGDLIERYHAGASLKQLSDELGVARHCIARNFATRGVQTRGRSAAERVKWQKIRAAGPEAVKRQVSAAHDAVRGRVVPAEEMARRARTRAQRISHVFTHERELLAAIHALGVAATPQRAVDRYNVDIALDKCRLAVEVLGSKQNRAAGRRHVQKAEALLDRGWGLLWVYAPGACDYAAVAHHAVAYGEILGRDESARRQHRVISGDAQPATPVCLDFYDGAGVLRPDHGKR